MQTLRCNITANLSGRAGNRCPWFSVDRGEQSPTTKQWVDLPRAPQALKKLSIIELFPSSARSQFNAMLKEVYVRREFADRARKACDELLKAALPTPIRSRSRPAKPAP